MDTVVSLTKYSDMTSEDKMMLFKGTFVPRLVSEDKPKYYLHNFDSMTYRSYYYENRDRFEKCTALVCESFLSSMVYYANNSLANYEDISVIDILKDTISVFLYFALNYSHAEIKAFGISHPDVHIIKGVKRLSYYIKNLYESDVPVDYNMKLKISRVADNYENYEICGKDIFGFPIKSATVENVKIPEVTLRG